MLFKPDKLNPDRPATKAAQAWYDYMLRGGQPRVMAPWEEVSWFEDVQTRVFLMPVPAQWLTIVEYNARRVALVLANSQYRRLSGINIQGAGQPTFLDESDPMFNNNNIIQLSFGSVTQPLDENGMPISQVWPLLPGNQPLILTQAKHGSLCQCAVQGCPDTNAGTGMTVAITEVILRDFPKQ